MCYRFEHLILVNIKKDLLLSVDSFDVECPDCIVIGEDTSAGKTTKNIRTVTFHEGTDTLVFDNLSTAIKSGFVVNT